MIVIPERGGWLIVFVAVTSSGSRCEPLFRQPVTFRASARSVQMRHGANPGRRRHSAVYVRIDGKNVLRGQIILPLNLNGVAAKRFDDGAGILSFVSPYSRRRKLRVHGVAAFQHAHLVCRYALAYSGRRQSFRNWKGIDKAVECSGRAIFLLKSRPAQEVPAVRGAGKKEGRYRLKTQF